MKIILTTILLFCANKAFQQEIKGLIIDADTRNRLAYATLAVSNRNTGTMSDRNGLFTIKLEDKYDKDTLVISAIGYKNLYFTVGDIKEVFYQSNEALQIQLTKKIYVLDEVFASQKFKKKVLGSKGRLGVIEFERDEETVKMENDTMRITEWGTVIKFKKEQAYILDVTLGLLSNNFNDSVIFRINIYDMNGDIPGENILKEPVIVSTKQKNGVLTVNLEKYNIEVTKDFLVSFELLVQKTGKISFSGGLKSRSFCRIGGYGTWEKFPILSLGIYTTVLFTK